MASNAKLRTVTITGASGLLGRALYKEFTKDPKWMVNGLAGSRIKDGFTKVDLLNEVETINLLRNQKPHLIIHCAAQRYCDKVDENYNLAYKLNVDASRVVAVTAAEIGAVVVYISTDYVFDGTAPPYKENDIPNPLNKYGVTKLEGEKATLQTNHRSCILRVPVLYGNVEFLNESAVTCLLNTILDLTKNSTVSDYEIRFPTHVDDIARICKMLSEKAVESDKVSGIFHCSAKEPLTKYGMVKIISRELMLPIDHIAPDSNATVGAPRPYNSQLNTDRLENVLGTANLDCIPFQAGIRNVLESYVNKS